MTTILSEGVKVPDVGSVNWAGDLEVNWNLLNGALANLSGNVKLDRDNIWTGEQSFTLPIVGSITGTASKAIADEDGTSIKTGYVNVAGNQTVSGQKTWSGTNTFSNSLSLASSSVTYNEAPSSNVELPSIRIFGGGRYAGAFDYVWRSTGENVIRLSLGSYKSDGTFGYWACNFGIPRDFSDGGKFGTPAFYPNGNNAYDLGTSSNQWKSVYAQTYYYNGTAWGLDKANTWTGSNTFVGSVILPAFGSSHYKNYGIVTDYGYTQANNYYRFLRTTGTYGTDNTPDTSKPSFLTFRPMRLQTELMDNIQVCNDGTNNYLAPITNNDTDLGTSTNKWKTLNGVNPGALSLPNLTANSPSTQNPPNGWISIDTTDWDKTGNLISYIPPVDGWISIITDNSSAANYIRCAYDNGDILAKANGNGYAQGLSVFLPVLKNVQIGIRLVCTTIGTAKLYPCQGNV